MRYVYLHILVYVSLCIFMLLLFISSIALILLLKHCLDGLINPYLLLILIIVTLVGALFLDVNIDLGKILLIIGLIWLFSISN